MQIKAINRHVIDKKECLSSPHMQLKDCMHVVAQAGQAGSALEELVHLEPRDTFALRSM